MRASSSAPINARPWAPGMCRDTTSAALKAAPRSPTGSPPAARIADGSRNGSKARTRMSKARAMSQTCRPIRPNPMSSSVLPDSSKLDRSLRSAHLPVRVAAS